MKSLILIFLAVCLFSCKSKDQQFCDCLKAGDALNTFSQKLFKGNVSVKESEKMAKLKEKKKVACQKYQIMNGKKMLELKKECN